MPSEEEKILIEDVKKKTLFLQALFDTILIPINYEDMEGNLIECNQAFADLVGKKKEEIVGKTLYDVWSKPTADILVKFDLDIIKNNLENNELETEYENLFGRKGTAIFSKHVFKDKFYNRVGVVVSITDTTQLKKQQEERQKFKLAVDNVADLIVITDPDSEIVYANRAVETITGYSLKEVVGNRSFLWGGQMPKEFYKNLWKIIKEDKKPFISELTNKRKSGELYIAEVKIAPILNEEGEIIFFVGIERDITLIRETINAKTKFVSIASHQLRTPLTGIKWLTEVMLKNKEGNLSEKQKEILKEINASNDRIINLVDDLLSISKIESGEAGILNLKKVEIEELINEVAERLRSVAEDRKADFKMAINLPKDYKLNIDEEKIGQSMINLISNAIKYSKPEGGRVGVSADIQNNEFVFSVKDNGIGISLKDQRRLFENFFRADNAVLSQTEGTGLGLPIVKSYVEAHGGRIWFESEENKGSTFYFSLKNN